RQIRGPASDVTDLGGQLARNLLLPRTAHLTRIRRVGMQRVSRVHRERLDGLAVKTVGVHAIDRSGLYCRIHDRVSYATRHERHWAKAVERGIENHTVQSIRISGGAVIHELRYVAGGKLVKVPAGAEAKHGFAVAEGIEGKPDARGNIVAIGFHQ